jgi:hypothetical protein
MSFNQIIASVLLVGIGFITYYCVPLAFVRGKDTIVFMILNLTLILVVIGLTFICTLLFNLMERCLLRVTLNTCCRRDRKLQDVILKNMEGH